jgi:hypothetical protein
MVGSEELKINGSAGSTILVKPLMQKAYEKQQSGRIKNAYRHYKFTGTASDVLTTDE